MTREKLEKMLLELEQSVWDAASFHDSDIDGKREEVLDAVFGDGDRITQISPDVIHPTFSLD